MRSDIITCALPSREKTDAIDNEARPISVN